MQKQDRYAVDVYAVDGEWVGSYYREKYQDTYGVEIPLGGHAVIRHIGGGQTFR